MPSSKQKSLEGLCPSYENNSRAFENVTQIVNDLKKVPALYSIITEDDVEILVKAVDTAKLYVKIFFAGRSSPMMISSHTAFR
jgi:hypothetical protein